MTFDLPTAAVMSSIVVLAGAGTFIATALSSRFASSGARLWGLGYVFMTVALLSSLVAVFVAENGWGEVWADALGNGAGVAFVGCLLLGLRAYNGNDVPGPALMVAALSTLTIAATLFDSPQPYAAAGSTVTYLSLAALTGGVTVHALLGRTRRHGFAWVLAGCFLIQALFYLARVVLVNALGPQDPVYLQWLGPIPWYMLTLSAGLVGTIAAFVLRSVLGTSSSASPAAVVEDAVLDAPTFVASLRGVLRRASRRTELVVVIAVLVDDVGTITASFGQEVADATTRVLRSAVREFASPVAVVGKSADRTIVLVTTTASSPADARRQAGLLYRGVVQRFVGAKGIVVPGVGVGVGLSSTLGYSAEVLVEGGTIAAVEAAESDETSVVFATARTLPSLRFLAEADLA
ncbi:hypothetical protein [Microbacterium caowuchunii]|uniref:GGDEF domain-containing protein n=1 Tax=Microbacterium caowuchunii TaxID=2614638 RepID=A0A5N0TL01_9MICO|nr:hypothetical protein [Microbacterium caowuchunii]KAA9135833.1 hypothetical protein F6B40_01200 [Microbacterium caowuchunii]